MKNSYILPLIWAHPIVVFFFFMLTLLYVPATPHPALLLKVLLVTLGFSGIVSFIYRRYNVIGLAVITGISSFFLFGFGPKLMQICWWVSAFCFTSAEVIYFYKSYSKAEVMKTVLSALIFIVSLIPYFNLGYSQPFNDSLLPKADVHLDTLYHVAIGAMLKVHHVVSHGMHGLGQLDYHFGSHILMTSAGNLTGVSVFESYSYFFPFFCIPILGILVLSVAEEFIPSGSTADFFKKAGIYAFIIIGTGILINGSLFYNFALWPSFFESESYTFSLILFLSFISLLNSKLFSSNHWFFMVIILIGIGLITISKISTGFCALAFLGSWALLSGEVWWSKKWMLRWIILFMAASIFFLLFKFINPGMGDAEINPFQFVNAYVLYKLPFGIKLILFLFFHFIFPVVVLSTYLVYCRKSKFKQAFPLWWFLGTLITLSVGVFVILMFQITGGSGYYFSNVSMFAALPAFVSMAFLLKNEKRIIKLILLIIILIGSVNYIPKSLVSGAKHFFKGMNREVINTNSLGNYIQKLRSIRDDHASLNSVVYIPRTEEYWRDMFCRSTGYFIPAISERPALYAWPSEECYDFLCGPRFYSNGLCKKSQEAYTDSQLLNEAKKMGFDSVYIVTSKSIRVLK